MATVVDLLARFRADTSNFSAGIQKARTDMLAFEKSAYGGAGNIGKGFDGLNSKSVALGAAIGTAIGQVATQALLKAGQAAKSFIVDSVKGASDLNESTTKTEAIFEGATDTIMKFASGAATAMGQSKQQALDAAGTFGIYGRSAGLSGQALADFAMQQTALASDLASFYNKSPEEAIVALGAAFRGQTEPARAFGVLMDDMSMRAAALKLGIISSTKEALTPQNKVLAANALIMEQTKVAQGDFAKTSAGLANQQRILAAQLTNTKTQFGQALLPTVLSVVGAFNTQVLPAFTAMSDKFKTLVSTITSQVAPVFANLKTVFSNLITAIGPTVSMIGGLLAIAFVTVVNVAKQFTSVLASVTGFLAKNKGIVMAIAAGFILLGGAIAGATLAFKIQMALTKAYAVVQVLMNLGNLASIASTNTLAASMLALNATLRANPIGAIVTVIALLVAGLILAWKKSQTFRDVVAKVFEVVANVVFLAIKAVLSYMKMMVNFWMSAAELVLKGAVKMFGWIPGIGGKVKAAAAGFEKLHDGVNDTFDKVIKGAEGMKNKVTAAVKGAAKAAGKSGDDAKTKSKTKTKTKNKVTDAVVPPSTEDLKAKADELLKTRGEGAANIAGMLKSVLGQPNDLQKALGGVTSTADSIISSYEKTMDAVGSRLKDIKGPKKDALMKYLNDSYTQLLAYAKKRDEVAKKLEAAQKKLEDAVAKRDDFAANTKKSLSDFATAAGILSKEDAVAVVNIVKTATGYMLTQAKGGTSVVDGITTQLKARLEQITTFSKNIKKLLANGLNKTYVEQLLTAGPEAAGATAAALVDASKTQIGEINGLYTDIAKVSDSFGTQMGESMYGAAVKSAQGLVDGYQAQYDAIVAAMDQIAAGITAVLEPLGKEGKALGDAMTQGLLDSIDAAIPGLVAKAKELADKVAAAMKVVVPSGNTTTDTSKKPVVVPKTGTGTTNTTTLAGIMSASYMAPYSKPAPVPVPVPKAKTDREMDAYLSSIGSKYAPQITNVAKGAVDITISGADSAKLDEELLGDVMNRKLLEALNGRRNG